MSVHKALSHPDRARILEYLLEKGEASFTELTKLLDTSPGKVSYHLRVLMEAGLVEETGRGTYKPTARAAKTTERGGRESKKPVPLVGSVVGKAIADVLSKLPFGFGRRESTVPVDLEARDVTLLNRLILYVDTSTVEVARGGYLRVTGRRSRRGKVGVEAEHGGDAVVSVDTARVRVEAPETGAIALANVDTSRVTIQETSPLRYLSARLDTSVLKGALTLRRGGGVLLSADTSNVDVRVAPEGPGEYWLEIEADTSSITIRLAAPHVRIVQEEVRTPTTHLEVPESRADAEVAVKLRVLADTSRIRIIPEPVEAEPSGPGG